MRISVTDAKGQLTELVRLAEAGDEIVLTRHGHPAVRLVPVKALPDRTGPTQPAGSRTEMRGREGIDGRSGGAESDFLYSDEGLPK